MDIPSMVAIDCNALISLCGSHSDSKVRLEWLLSKLDKTKGKLLLPMPAVAEFLTGADQASLEVHHALTKKASVVLGSFDLAAAHENALMEAAALGRRDKRDSSVEPWQKVKIDRQIVAISRSQGAKLIVSNDAGVRAAALRVGLAAVHVDELDFPDAARQLVIENLRTES
jgi:hypothetical protein